MTGAVVERITRHAGIAGQYQLTAHVRYPGEGPSVVAFVGSVYGGPVVMISESGAQVFVTEPERFGEFGESWVRRFFGAS